MNIKRKLILIGICIAIIIVVFTVNVMRKIQEDNQGPIVEDTVNENVMTRAEAYRLLSYLDYDKTEREAIPIGITYADAEMSDWYDSYVNAVWKMGLIEGNVTVAPTEALTYGTCKQLIDNLIIKNPEFQTVYEGLSFDFSKADEDMLIPEFLEIYQAILDTIPQEELTLKEETLFVLGRDITEDGIDRMVTDMGKYYYLNAKSYEEFLTNTNATENNDSVNPTGAPSISAVPDVTTEEDVTTFSNRSEVVQDLLTEKKEDAQEASSEETNSKDAATEDESAGEDSTKVEGNKEDVAEDGSEETGTDSATTDHTTTDDSSTDSTVEESAGSEEDEAVPANGNVDSEAAMNQETSLIDQYLDKGIKALVCEQEIIYIKSSTTDEIVLQNVWIKKGEGTDIDTFINGIDKSFTAEYKLSSGIEKVIGNLTVKDQKIIQISVKPDMIQGKVLRSGKDFIEIEGYGEVPLEENYKIYKIYGTLSVEPTGSILVGYENTDFIVSGGKISAALITSSIKAENIRVLIETTGYKNMYHDSVELTATEDFTISSKETAKEYKAGDKVTLKSGSKLLKDGRITVSTVSGEGKIQLLSIERSYGIPKYRGKIEIAEDEEGLMVVNELPLEEYLYAVIPSEMPTSYGTEALKVQAVCARSYAYKHLLSNSLSQYGAHVNDSVDYQVYNNIAENEDSILAVKDTYGKVAEYDGEVINALYFSTSCGHTADAANAWTNNTDVPYLNGKLLLVPEEVEGSDAQNELVDRYDDLSTEDNFKNFITSTDFTTYDSSFNWYRWKVTISVKDLKKVIDENVSKRYKANPEAILTMTKEAKDGEEAVYESIPVDTVGTIVDITVLKRERSGMISEILITGSKNTIKVKTEYNVRALLAPLYDTITRLDDSKVDNLKVLPSAFFSIDKKMKDEKLSSIALTGGGYGHGVGLSQNGVKGMVDTGMDYEEIVTYFYEGTEIGYIYE